MSTVDATDQGIRILSFDNGTSGTYSQIIVVKEYMGRLANDLRVDEFDLCPADYFDLMGGVGFGGLIAFMFGYLRMNTGEAIDALVAIALAIFPCDPQEQYDSETRLRILKDAIEDMLQARQIPLDMKMNDARNSSEKCHIVLYAATSANLSHPTAFRTYSSRGSSLNSTIVEALCATIAVPSFFSPVKIGRRPREQSFVGAPIGTNNPTRELLKEASRIFGEERRVSQILSVGSGRRRVLSLEGSVTMDAVTRLAGEVASDCETVAHEFYTRLFSVTSYLRLNVDRGMEELSMIDWSDLGAIESHTSAYVENPAISRAIEVSLRNLQERTGTITLGQINHSSSIKITSKSAPALSPYYVVRQKEYGRMRRHLVESTATGQKVFAITGMGGCGKTQMVSYFLREHRSLFAHVVFVDASSQSSIKGDLQAWYRSLGNGHEQGVWEDGLRLLASGSHDTQWVYILDNADDPEFDLLPFLPKCHHGTVLITSRNRDVGHLANTYHLELGKMEPEEGLSTLMQAARRLLPLSSEELEDAHELMKELGYLALALVHVGTYCQQLSSTVDGAPQPYSFTKYLALYHAQRAILMKKAGPAMLDGYRRGVYTTLDLSYQVLLPKSRDFLHVLSNFNHSDISFSMLETAAKNLFKDPDPISLRPDDHDVIVSYLSGLLCTDGVWDELKVQDTIQNLRCFSLLSTTVVGDTVFLQLHPLVQAWARDKKLANSPDYRRMTRQLLTSCCSDNGNPLNRHLISHINEMLHAAKQYPLHVNDKTAAAQVFKEQGQYRDAEVLLEEALDTMRNTSSRDTRESLLVTGWLAEVLWRGGEWEKAGKMETEVLEQRRRLLGLEHPETILAAANLACTYRDQGRLDEAEKLKREVLEQSRRVLGLEHPKTILAAANLAAIYGDQGRFNEAEKLETEVLEQSRRILGLEHPRAILAAANLACTYRDQGRLDEAEKLKREVLEQSRRVLGLEHPKTILAAANLAAIYGDQGRFNEAEKLETEVLEQNGRVLGPEHPDTTQAAANLAGTYHDQGRLDEAEKLRLEVLEQDGRILGPEHPQTILAAANLACTYHNQGRFDEAEKLETEVLEQRRRLLGLEHPDTIRAAGNLGATYYHQRKWEEAKNLMASAVEGSIKVLGRQHPNTQRRIRSLIHVYKKLDKLDEAKEVEKLLLP